MRCKTIVVLAALAYTCFGTGCAKEKPIGQPGNLVPKTVDENPTLPAISLNGSLFHAETFGNSDSNMLVVVHGGPGADYRYLLNCQAFADEGYFVVFYDQRGAGLSKRHGKGAYTVQVMIDDLDAIIGHYRSSAGQKVFLLGHSWGAMLATAYINAFPEKISGAVLAEPGGFVWQDVKDYVSKSRDYRLAGEAFNDVLYGGQFITGGEGEHEILDYKYILLSAAEGTDESPIGNEGLLPFWRPGAVANMALFNFAEQNGFDVRANLYLFTTKVLFVYSERNSAYGLAHAQRVSSAYPKAQLERVAGAGHDFIAFPTGWQNFYPLALAYLKELNQ